MSRLTRRTCILVHPNPAPASVIFDAISNVLKIPLVLYSEWILRLESAALSLNSNLPHKGSGNDRNPGVQLLDFFRSKADAIQGEDDDTEAFSITRMDNKGILAAAPSLHAPTLMEIKSNKITKYTRNIRGTTRAKLLRSSEQDILDPLPLMILPQRIRIRTLSREMLP